MLGKNLFMLWVMRPIPSLFRLRDAASQRTEKQPVPRHCEERSDAAIHEVVPQTRNAGAVRKAFWMAAGLSRSP
jgi:hypothetical protein